MKKIFILMSFGLMVFLVGCSTSPTPTSSLDIDMAGASCESEQF